MNESLGESGAPFEPVPIAVCCPKVSETMFTTSTQCVADMIYEPVDTECKACGYKPRCELALVNYKKKHLIGRRKI